MAKSMAPELGFILLAFTVTYWGTVACAEVCLELPWDH